MNSLTLHRHFRALAQKDPKQYEVAKKANPREWQKAVLKISKSQVITDPELGLTFAEAVRLYAQLRKLGLPENTKVSLLRYPNGIVLAHYPQKFGVGSFRI